MMNPMLAPSVCSRQLAARQLTGRYFTHGRGGCLDAPLLDQLDVPRKISHALHFEAPVNPLVTEPIGLCLGRPRPRKPKMVDYLSEPSPYISTKFKEVMEAKSVSTAEYVPAQVETHDEVFPYWRLHALASHNVIDFEQSKYVRLSSFGIRGIDRLVLDYEKINEIALEDRLFFLAEQTAKVYLWHESLVELIEMSGIVEIRFSPADNYSRDQAFAS